MKPAGNIPSWMWKELRMKYWYESKTLWFNLLVLVASLAEVTEVINILSAEQLKYFMATAAIANLILRIYFTDMKLKA